MANKETRITAEPTGSPRSDSAKETGSPRSDSEVDSALAYHEAKQAEGQKARPKPKFISEGTRVEIERTGQALDPFTGRTLTKEDL